MNGLLTVLSVLTAWALLGVLGVALLLMFKSVQSIRHWFEKNAVSVRAVEWQTADFPARAAVLTASLRETIHALSAGTALPSERKSPEEPPWTT